MSIGFGTIRVTGGGVGDSFLGGTYNPGLRGANPADSGRTFLKTPLLGAGAQFTNDQPEAGFESPAIVSMICDCNETQRKGTVVSVDRLEKYDKISSGTFRGQYKQKLLFGWTTESTDQNVSGVTLVRTTNAAANNNKEIVPIGVLAEDVLGSDKEQMVSVVVKGRTEVIMPEPLLPKVELCSGTKLEVTSRGQIVDPFYYRKTANVAIFGKADAANKKERVSWTMPITILLAPSMEDAFKKGKTILGYIN